MAHLPVLSSAHLARISRVFLGAAVANLGGAAVARVGRSRRRNKPVSLADQTHQRSTKREVLHRRHEKDERDTNVELDVHDEKSAPPPPQTERV